ncbi:hypothetical protein QTP88_016870 [Uroleucon formosanum]
MDLTVFCVKYRACVSICAVQTFPCLRFLTKHLTHDGRRHSTTRARQVLYSEVLEKGMMQQQQQQTLVLVCNEILFSRNVAAVMCIWQEGASLIRGQAPGNIPPYNIGAHTRTVMLAKRERDRNARGPPRRKFDRQPRHAALSAAGDGSAAARGWDAPTAFLTLNLGDASRTPESRFVQSTRLESEKTFLHAITGDNNIVRTRNFRTDYVKHAIRDASGTYPSRACTAAAAAASNAQSVCARVGRWRARMHRDSDDLGGGGLVYAAVAHLACVLSS